MHRVPLLGGHPGGLESVLGGSVSGQSEVISPWSLLEVQSPTVRELSWRSLVRLSVVCERAERGDFPLVSAGAVRETDSTVREPSWRSLVRPWGLCEGQREVIFPSSLLEL